MNKKIFGGMVFAVFVLLLSSGLNSTTAYQRSDFLRLVENSDQCLVDCYAVIEVSNPTGEDIILSENNWRVWYEKAHGARLSGNLKLELEEDVSYDVEVDDYENVTESLSCDGDFGFGGNHAWCYSDNGTLAWNTSFEAIVPENGKVYWTGKNRVGSHTERKTRKKYFDFNPAGKILKPGETYQIKISGKKKAQTGPNNIDWKIKFLDFEPDWAWWNSNWEHKKPVEIKSVNNLIEYQMAFNVTYHPDMKPDFSDLRFTNEEETQELSYWIENKIDGVRAYVWVKVDSIDSSNGTQAYMYYGNAWATSKSNEKDTFILFDEFDIFSGWSEGPENSGYTLGSPSVDVHSSHLYPDNYGSRSAYGWHGPVANISFPSTADFALRVKHYWSAGGSVNYQWQEIHLRSGSSYVVSYSLYDGGNDADGKFYVQNGSIDDMGNGATTISDLMSGYGTFLDRYAELTRTRGNLSFRIDGALRFNTIQPETPINNIRIVFGQAGTYATSTNEISQILLRKYTSPEPAYSIGSEETRPEPPENITGGTIKTTSGNIILDPATSIVEIDGKLTMKSPNGSWFCCGPSDSGTWTCKTGKCA